MTVIILTVFLLAYILIATGKWTKVNKAAVAIFAGTLCWVLYISYGTDFVTSQHQTEFLSFLGSARPDAVNVKEFIANNIFLKYVGRAAEVVLFLLATMTIVEILDNNGCFDFISQLLKTRHSQRMLWTLGTVTFIISANLDNLSTTVMMLTIMHKIIPSRRQRMIYGAAVVLAATCGGALTVIGDPTGLVLWNMGAVTASNLSMSLALPCLIAWGVPTWLLGRALPEHVDTERISLPYRGDDTNLNVWQRIVMLLVGIGGLWFIPSFHNITKLSPFLGALCVLSVLWIVNEIFNRKLLNAERSILRRMPLMMKYGTVKLMLFVIGIMLLAGVLTETGIIGQFTAWVGFQEHSAWLVGGIAGVTSSVLDSFASAMSFISLHPVDATTTGTVDAFACDGWFWKIIAYTTGVGSNILALGSMSGLAYLRLERVHIGWYFRNVGWKALVGIAAGYGILYFTI